AKRTAGTVAAMVGKSDNKKPAAEKPSRSETRERAFAPQVGYAGFHQNSIGRPFDGAEQYGARGTLGRLEQQPATKEEDSDRASFAAPGTSFDRLSQMSPVAPPASAAAARPQAGTLGGPLAAGPTAKPGVVASGGTIAGYAAETSQMGNQ